MTEEQVEDSVVALRDEMNAQFAQLKESFEASIKEKDEIIAQLKEQNVGLQRALVRSAVMDPPKQDVPKSQEELYQDELNRRIERTKFYMKRNV